MQWNSLITYWALFANHKRQKEKNEVQKLRICAVCRRLREFQEAGAIKGKEIVVKSTLEKKWTKHPIEALAEKKEMEII